MIHLDLQPELEAQLALEAKSFGLSIEQYIEQLVYDRATDDDQALQEALDDTAHDRTVSAREAFAQLREEYDIRG